MNSAPPCRKRDVDGDPLFSDINLVPNPSTITMTLDSTTPSAHRTNIFLLHLHDHDPSAKYLPGVYNRDKCHYLYASERAAGHGKTIP